jgi:hypothetical protein
MSATKPWALGKAWALSILAIVALGGGACSKQDEHAHASEGHGHQPKNGGQLLEVGKHQFNIEVLVDAPKGKVTAWILDAHAEDYVRVAAPTLRMSAAIGPATKEIQLAAVANAASGEKVGDTSQFEGSADWLKSNAPFNGTFHDVTIRGVAFGNVTFQHGKPSTAQ